ncbi:glucosaminidase domain-containing protein [Alkalilimnicola ehrlichii]|nr:glucosaminidase domain-containing protein [Alkalilimnicola ehrlichii]
MTPLVLAENARIREKRARLQTLLSRDRLAANGQRELEELAARYRIEGDLHNPEVREQLLRRVDEIPLGLALAQAAKESGWGTSRFALEGNNLFGVWTWDETQGMVPINRPEGATHLVRIFPDLQEAVRNYMHTLNTGRAYYPMRMERQRLRIQGELLDPLRLAGGLESYSERGAPYVRELWVLIASNGLHRLDEYRLAPHE